MLQNMQWKVKNVRTVLFLARVVYSVRSLSHYCSMKWLGLGQAIPYKGSGDILPWKILKLGSLEMEFSTF